LLSTLGRRQGRPPEPDDLSHRGGSVYPDDLKYTAEHEWVRAEDDGSVTFGITDYAQDALGDIVFVTLPPAATEVSAGDAIGEVESTKSVSDVYAPLSGSVLARNDALEATPEIINSDPYGEGWMLRMRPADPSALASLLDSDAYAAHVAEA
ncbi:MAG: glycine cleavage system protein GcvH, partial [Actinomycetes bacterium]